MRKRPLHRASAIKCAEQQTMMVQHLASRGPRLPATVGHNLTCRAEGREPAESVNIYHSETRGVRPWSLVFGRAKPWAGVFRNKMPLCTQTEGEQVARWGKNSQSCIPDHSLETGAWSHLFHQRELSRASHQKRMSPRPSESQRELIFTYCSLSFPHVNCP